MNEYGNDNTGPRPMKEIVAYVVIFVVLMSIFSVMRAHKTEIKEFSTSVRGAVSSLVSDATKPVKGWWCAETPLGKMVCGE